MMRRIFADGLLGLFFMSVVLSFNCGREQKKSKALTPFANAEMEWRKERDVKMKAPTSWLTIAGLLWLGEGENGFGSAPQNKIKLPEGSAPEFIGKFILNNNKVTVEANENSGLTCSGKSVKKMTLKSDMDGGADILAINDLRMWVIKRGDRFAIRLRDLNAAAYKNYKGLNFFPPNERFRLKGEFVHYIQAKMIEVGTEIGTTVKMASPGYVKFAIDGKEYQLDAFDSQPGELSFIFRDGTSGIETYGASRFMEAKFLADSTVDLNFNRAYNPPCAYTPFATCPLPPPENNLTVKIEAGEKKYGEGH